MANLIECISPVDGSVYASSSPLDMAAAKELLRNTRLAQQLWTHQPLEHRCNLVRKGVELLGRANDKIVEEMAWMIGRPTRFGGEFSVVDERAQHLLKIAAKSLSPIVAEDSGDFLRKIERVPHGIVLVIAPWNYPYITAVNTIIPALLAGNAVVIKHSPQSLLAGERLAEAFQSAGIPKELIWNASLENDTLGTLISDGEFDFINFTGSVGTGKIIEKASAGTFSGLGLELGGKDPAYVMEDADIDLAIDGILDAAMFNTGQSCCSIERIYLSDLIYDEFIEKFVAETLKFKIGSPLDSETTMGPTSNVRFADRIRAQVDAAISDGAKDLVSDSDFGELPNASYVRPSVLVDVTHDMDVMRSETFGPVVGIMKVSSDQEALKLMNDSNLGLTASIWTASKKRASSCASKLDFGTVFMNRADYLDPALCWTGWKDSGRGGALSKIGFHNLTRPQSHYFRL